MLESNPLYYKKKPCVKISFDLFLFNVMIALFGRCSMEGAALTKEPHKCLLENVNFVKDVTLFMKKCVAFG